MQIDSAIIRFPLRFRAVALTPRRRLIDIMLISQVNRVARAVCRKKPVENRATNDAFPPSWNLSRSNDRCFFVAPLWFSSFVFTISSTLSNSSTFPTLQPYEFHLLLVQLFPKLFCHRNSSRKELFKRLQIFSTDNEKFRIASISSIRQTALYHNLTKPHLLFSQLFRKLLRKTIPEEWNIRSFPILGKILEKSSVIPKTNFRNRSKRKKEEKRLREVKSNFKHFSLADFLGG